MFIRCEDLYCRICFDIRQTVRLQLGHIWLIFLII